MYDTIVLGNDMSSLIAAVTLASHGNKALLLTTDSVPNFFSESGYTFDIDPLPWTGMNTGGIFSQFMAHLGITHETHILDPALQIISQNHRVDLCGSTDVDLKEMEREFPDDGWNLAKFYSSSEASASVAAGLINKGVHLQPDTSRDYIKLFKNIPCIAMTRRAFGTNLEAIRKQPLIKKFLEAQILLLSNLDPRNIRPISFARVLSMSSNGLSYLSRGKHYLASALEKKFEADGGVIEKYSTLTIEAERVIKINLKSEVSNIPTVYGRNLIVSTKYEGLSSLLKGDGDLSFFKKKYDKLKPSLYPFTIHIGVDDRCIPEKMGVYVIVSDETNSIKNGNPLFLETSEAGDILRAPDGKRAISITTFLKNPPSKSNNSVLENIAESMLVDLGSFLPFLKENIDFVNLQQSIYVSKRYHRTISNKYIMRNPFIGMSFLSGKTPLKNIFLTGGMLMPGLGFEGEIMSGMDTARLAMGEDQI